MIKGFEEITAKLSEKELELVPVFVSRLSLRVGKEKAVTSSQIIKGFKDTKGIDLSGARVRKIINYIRMTEQLPLLIATSEGYYISNDKHEILDYIESLRGREKAIAAIRIKLENELYKLEL